ncbi:hypothetical protein WAF17_00060 [Bernardetia sp. ABR2-2B]|uniref:hypothetical protein n=1 Tax=Bernardetia sp. ABR2-2B TaxID=3127472 RepID=UPI0030D11131
MKKIVLSYILSLTSFFVSAQDADITLEKFRPLPIDIQKIKGIQYTIFEGDTTSENFSEYEFDKNGNLIRWEYFPYYVKEELKYDSLNRIVEIDGLYGESLSNGIIKYEYPSATQKIEIHDKMGYYQYIKLDFTFDDDNRVLEEVKYDSTSITTNDYGSATQSTIINSYDKDGNLIKASHYEGMIKKLIYEVDITYKKGKFISQSEKCFKGNICTDSEIIFSYIKKGDFKDKKNKETSWIFDNGDTIKIETQYFYQKIDSITVSQEEKVFRNNQLTERNKYFYKNNQLIKLEEYTIPKGFDESRLSVWTEYTYFFYPKTEK